MGDISRRGFIAGGVAAAASARTAASDLERDGVAILGPRNVPLERQNPDLLEPPSTDAGTLPNLKFPFDQAHNRVARGGWAREVSERELAPAKEVAGVDMRLEPGGIREMHWHKAAEWSFMLAGSAQITAIDAEGRNFLDDVGPGDLWYFPAGTPHAIQALDDGCEFLLVFDSGAFAENGTFLITDWFAHTPRSVLAKNFGVPESAFDDIPTDPDAERYIFPGPEPASPARATVRSPAGRVPHPFSYRLSERERTEAPGGSVVIVDSSEFEVSKTIAAAVVDVEPGAMREMHWHPNADEWQYWVEGQGRMTVFAAEGTARTFDYREGDVGYVPFAMGHYIENTGSTRLRYLEVFRSDHYADVSLNQWMALTPPAVVRAHLNLDRRTIAALSRKKQVVVR